MKHPLTPLDLIRRAFKVYPQRVAVIDGDRRVTYAEFARLTYRLARALRQAGVGRGTNVALLAPNTMHALLAYHAVPLTGATLIPLNTRLETEEYAFLLRHGDVKLILIDAALRARVQSVLTELTTPVWAIGGGGDLPDHLTGVDDTPLAPPEDLDEDDVITINYTSGTTRDPKGVMLTHRNTYLGALNMMYHLDLRPGSVQLHTLPLPHVNAWGTVWAATGAGATHVTCPAPSTEGIYADIQQHGVTHLCAVPTVLNLFIDPITARRVPHPVKVTMAGSPPHAQFLADLEGLGFQVVHTYGLSEASPLVTHAEDTPEMRALPPAERATILARQGYEMVAAGEVDVVDEHGQRVAHDGQQLGEIVIRSNLVMKGYYKNDEATREALRDGWLHTGDIACVHPDGRIEIRDRAKDLIISGGEHVSSVEVEGILHRHPSVKEAVVVAAPHEQLGEVPVAFVVLHAGARLEPRDLIEFVRPHLAPFKVPAHVTIAKNLPKTPNGKLRKNILRAQARTGHLDPIG